LRCQADRGIATASRPSTGLSGCLSVCPSVTLRYRRHMVRNLQKWFHG